MASRRGFLGALAAVPVLVPLVKAEPADNHAEHDRLHREHVAERKEESAVLLWKDGYRETVTLTAPLGKRIFKARQLRPQNTSAFDRDSAPRFGVDIEQVVFERTNRRAFWSSTASLRARERQKGPLLPVYEEV